jgi:hypothetical protein
VSKHEDDIVFAAQIVSVIAKKTNKKHRLYVLAKPPWESLYPQVKFDNNIPIVLQRLSRKPLHHDVVEDDECLYINTWIKQQRHLFLKKASGDRLEAARMATASCIKLLGLRKRISKKDLLSLNCPKKELKIKDPSSFSGIIATLMPHDYLIEHTRSILSAVDTVGYYASFDTKMDILVQTTNSEMIYGAISRSDVVVSKNQMLLLPFFNVAKDKKIFLIEPDNMIDIFEDTTIVQDVTGLIKSLTAVARGEM